MCSRDDAWWHSQCMGTCSKCPDGRPPCTTDDRSVQGACDSSCLDVKSEAECLLADQTWGMCTGSDVWWPRQCQFTCAKCDSGKPPCKVTVTQGATGDCDQSCIDVKSKTECQRADQVWSMCS